jgi:hypothetical protein
MPQSLRSTGATIWIGTTATDGATDTYVEIAKAKQVSTFGGGAYTMTDTTALGDTIRQTTKTLLDPADIDLEINELPADAGQIALKAAFDSTGDDPYNFEVRFAQGDKRRLKGKVVSLTNSVGTATNVRMLRAKLEPTTAPVYVAA